MDIADFADMGSEISAVAESLLLEQGERCYEVNPGVFAPPPPSLSPSTSSYSQIHSEG